MIAREPITPRGPVSAAEYAMIVAQSMDEGTFQRQLEVDARKLGWRCYHTKMSAGSSAGFPDLVAVRGNRIIFAELKRQADRYKPTEKQQAWLDDLHLAATWSSGVVEVYLWRPYDLTRSPSPIMEVLA